MQIEQSVIDILKEGKFENSIFFLPNIKLDRKMYLKVNEVLENAGGKWNRSRKGHVFEKDPRKLWEAVETGETVNEKKLYQFFETPKEVVKKMIELAEIGEGMSILEPSAGHGAIAEELEKLPCEKPYCLEIDPDKVGVLREKNLRAFYWDFMNFNEHKFDRIVMNPPFTKGQDAKHVLHAYELLNDGGILVSVMSASVTFNQSKNYAKIREIADIIELPSESFKASGTTVNTVLVKIQN